MRGVRTRVHEDRELAGARWVRRAAADICELRRSAPTWAPAPSLFSKLLNSQTSMCIAGRRRQFWS